MQVGNRQAGEMAGTLSEVHIRRSDREQLEMGRYIYCKADEGGGNR